MPEPHSSSGKDDPKVDFETLKSLYTKANQSHVFQFYDTLSTTEQQSLLKQLSQFQPDRIHHLFQQAHAHAKVDLKQLVIQPLPSSICTSVHQLTNSQLQQFESVGLKALKENKVAIVCLAGGQGTRLGSSSPKGCYNIGLPSTKSLFQLQAERILKLQSLASSFSSSTSTNTTLSTSSNQGSQCSGGVQIPWLIMVSGPTRIETETFFKTHAYFGLDPHQFTFFEQGTLPALDEQNKLIMESRSQLAIAPDGNGGIYDALVDTGVLKTLEAKKIEHVHVYCVDNCLVKPGDPVFLGFNILSQAQVGAKCVAKTNPDEPVGVLCLRDGKYTVVEYSELPSDLAKERDPKSGQLMYHAANIANHYYTVAFLSSLAAHKASLPYHLAHKKITHVNEQGELVVPKAPNGWKLERFIFDVFPLCSSFSVMLVERSAEFAPLKNKTGEDSPQTARQALMQLHATYLTAAGAIIPNQKDPTFSCEISPLISYAGEGLETRVKGKTLTSPIFIHE